MEGKSPKNRRYLIDQSNFDDSYNVQKKNSDMFDISFNMTTPKMKENMISMVSEDDTTSVISEMKSTLNESMVSFQELSDSKPLRNQVYKQPKKQVVEENKTMKQKAQTQKVHEDYQIILFANPKSGSCLAEKFLTEIPQENTRLLSARSKVVACNMKTYDMTKRDERDTAIKQIEQTIQIYTKSRIVVAIMGGDGSLGLLLQALKKNETIYKGMDKIQFCMLPFGTGNDTGQVFGWGKNPGEWSENVEVLMNAIITAKVDALTIWNVHVDGQLYDPYDNLMEVNDLTLCCYFNLGIDAEIGTSFERQRTKSRMCNKILYFLHGFYKFLNIGSVAKVKDYIQHVKQKPANRHHKMIADMDLVESDPLNMIGMNLPQMYGGILQNQTWEDTKEQRFIDKRTIINRSGIKLHGWDTETSSCAEEEKNVQRYDDDKMELLGASDPLNFALFRMHQFGQARSPYAIDFKKTDTDEERTIYFAVDGEFYKIKQPKSIEFKIDRMLPRIKMLRYNPSSSDQ